MSALSDWLDFFVTALGRCVSFLTSCEILGAPVLGIVVAAVILGVILDAVLYKT